MKMTSKLFLLTFLVFVGVIVCITHAKVLKVDELPSIPAGLSRSPRTSTLELRQAGILPRQNIAVAAASQMQTEWLIAGLKRLQFLLDYNTKNKELLREMNLHFQKYADYDWHISLQEESAGAVPPQYAYYRFDRNTTELFVGGYRRC